MDSVTQGGASGSEQIAITITEVRYSRLVSFGNYENEQIGASAAVAGGVGAADTLAALRQFVDDQLSGRREGADLRENIYQQRAMLAELTRGVEAMQDRYNRSKAFLEGLGISTADLRGYRASDLDDVPF